MYPVKLDTFNLDTLNLVLFFIFSDFIWDFGKLPFPTHLGKYFIKIGKIRAKIHEIGKMKAIFGLGMTPIYGLKNGQIKSLIFIHTLCMGKAKALQQDCLDAQASLSLKLLLAGVISTKYVLVHTI